MRAQLLHLSGPLRGRTITHAEPIVVVGSGAEATVVLPVPEVRPRHGRIVYEEAHCAFLLQALDGPVFVNGDQVQEVELQDDDLIEWGIGGPKARFRAYVEPGAVCKPVRRMLADAAAVGEVSGGVAATTTLTRDLLTQATLTLKIGFPLAVLGIAALTGLFAGWFASRPSAAERRRTADMVTQQELVALREAQQQQQREIEQLLSASAAMRRIREQWSRGVCLLHGRFQLLLADGTPVGDGNGQPLVVEYTGSGFRVTALGHIVTNRHVAAPWRDMDGIKELVARGLRPQFLTFTATFPGRLPIAVPPESARLRDDDLDVAVLQIDAALLGDVPVLPLHQGPLDRGDPRAVVVGYPTGLGALLARADNALVEALQRESASMTTAIDRLAAAGQISPLMTQGIVGNEQDRLLVYDAPTTHGGSGGPVFGSDGTVIGVNQAILRDFAGANFGVPIRYAVELLPR